ncbi:uncharacterized protein LOC108668108 [Hyalella azteca]|uniref:Uncharacterized protein LOC108668108 n=1 Tax=Hyalella azteca TaxID=294128 RepID=A0A8B7NAW9_HYAAZ|nr:uncharacterized protein LOC108668108 [Hyalella azteca]
MTARNVATLKSCTSLLAISQNSSIIIEEGEGASCKVYCSVCRAAFGLQGKFDHGRVMESSREFCRGFRVESTELLSSETQRRKFYSIRRKIVDHLLGASSSGDAHIQAVLDFKNKTEEQSRVQKVAVSHVSAALACIKMKSAGVNYENIIALLAGLGVDVGTLQHSR